MLLVTSCYLSRCCLPSSSKNSGIDKTFLRTLSYSKDHQRWPFGSSFEYVYSSKLNCFIWHWGMKQLEQWRSNNSRRRRKKSVQSFYFTQRPRIAVIPIDFTSLLCTPQIPPTPVHWSDYTSVSTYGPYQHLFASFHKWTAAIHGHLHICQSRVFKVPSWPLMFKVKGHHPQLLYVSYVSSVKLWDRLAKN